MEENTIKKLTILHSNDLHGDFLPKETDGKETGGLSRLAGYVNKVRSERENVIYAIAGDMFRGSVIDSEYQGLSTIDLMNNLNPDVATIGNHEVDYGFAHLLFLEKCAKFPIVNANLFITMNNAALVFDIHAHIKEDEREDVHRLLDGFVKGLATAVARVALDTDEVRAVADVAVLQGCRVLE